MIAPCQAPGPDGSFISGLLNFVDCQAQTLGAGGYQALTAPGSTLPLILTGLLTIFIALFGYRMMLGQAPTMRDGVLAMIKLGIVLTFATSWAAYRTLVYDVALKTPAELAAEIGRPAGLPGAGGGLVPRLDNADRLLIALSEAGPGPGMPRWAGPSPEAIQAALAAQPVATMNSHTMSLGAARILFLTGAAGALAGLRLVAGLLLALGPLFFAFLLFDTTRGLFEGWLRVLAGTALGAVGVALVLGVELALIEPRLAYLIGLRAAGYAIPGAAVEIFVVALTFLIVLAAMLAATARLAWGFRFPAAWRDAVQHTIEQRSSQRIAGAHEYVAAGADRSRAAAVVDAVAASQRREAGPVPAGWAPAASGRRSAPQTYRQDEPATVPAPLGHSFRRTRNRASASSARRDRL